MEKSLLVVLLLGVALMSYAPISELFVGEELGTCSCGSIQSMVAWAEGTRKCVYKDSLGIPTVGIGFNMKRGDARTIFKKYGINYDSVLSGKKCLSDKQVTDLFNHDLVWAKSGAKHCVPSFSKHNKCIQNVLMDMTFNMGQNSLCSWKTFNGHLAAKHYKSAGSYVKSTLYCKQVGRRCTRNVNLIESC